jgi:hypothetical protein
LLGSVAAREQMRLGRIRFDSTALSRGPDPRSCLPSCARAWLRSCTGRTCSTASVCGVGVGGCGDLVVGSALDLGSRSFSGAVKCSVRLSYSF